MKFLEARDQDPDRPERPAHDENKMRAGSRPDQAGTRPATEDPTVIRADVRELASSLGVALHTVKGTGKGGAITITDVRRTKDENDKRAGEVQNDPKL